MTVVWVVIVVLAVLTGGLLVGEHVTAVKHRIDHDIRVLRAERPVGK
jgi:hypothetical protein